MRPTFFVLVGHVKLPMKILVGYYASWSIYQRNFSVEDCPFSKLTHLNYAFAEILDNRIQIVDEWADLEHNNFKTPLPDSNEIKGNIGMLIKMKSQYPKIKIGVSVGGWQKSSQFSRMVRNDLSRCEFIASVRLFLSKYKFDYIDIDWEYPVCGGMESNETHPNDAENFLMLLKELHTALKSESKFITVASPIEHFAKQWNLIEMANYVEFFNIMANDFSGKWSTKSTPHCNLYGKDDQLSVDSTMRFYMSHIPASKLVMGIPLYGRSFITTGLGKEFSKVGEGIYEEGIIENRFINLENIFWDATSASAYCVYPETSQLISFDNWNSVALKLEYINNHDIAGVMFWELSGDSDEFSIVDQCWSFSRK